MRDLSVLIVSEIRTIVSESDCSRSTWKSSPIRSGPPARYGITAIQAELIRHRFNVSQQALANEVNMVRKPNS